MMRRLFVLCLMVVCSAAAWAQQTGSFATVTLDLDEAVRIALDENPTIKIAELEIERQDYIREETLSNLYPQLSASGTYNRAIKKSTISGNISFEPDNTVQGSVSLSLPLFVPGVYQTLKLNREQMLAAVEAARGSRLTLVNEVKKTYYQILMLEQSLEVLYQSQATTQQTVDNIRLQFENEITSEYDLLTAEVQLSNLQPSIIQTENAIEVSKLMLKMYLNLPVDLDVRLAGDIMDHYDELLPHIDGYLSEDYSNNSDLRSLEIQQSILERQFKVLRTQRMPTLAAFGSYTLSANDPINLNFLGDPAAANTAWMWQHPISAGVTLSVPIFSGFSKRAQERQLRNSIEQLRYQREYAEEGIHVQVKNTISSLITAQQTAFANEKTVLQAAKAYSISETRYNAEAGTILELNNAELLLTQAKLNYTQAIYDYLAAMADYELAVGNDYQLETENN